MNLQWKVALWVIALYSTAKYGVADVFCVISGIIVIFINLGERKGASAYSVFNKDCKKLAGDLDPTAAFKRGKGKANENLMDASFIVKNYRLANKPCPCGSGKKHKKCCYIAKDIED